MKNKKQRTERPKGRKHRSSPSSRNKPPRTIEEYTTRGRRFQEVWNRITQVISRMRGNKISLQKASRELGVDPRTVVRRGGTALRKSSSGRYEIKKSDRFLRVLVFPTHDGTDEIAVRGSRQASQLGQYWSAVQKYL